MLLLCPYLTVYKQASLFHNKESIHLPTNSQIIRTTIKQPAENAISLSTSKECNLPLKNLQILTKILMR